VTFNPIPSRRITFQMIIDANQYIVTCLIETLQEHANGTATVQCNSEHAACAVQENGILDII